MGKLKPGSAARSRALEKVRRLIGKNYSDDEIMETLGMLPKTLQSLKKELLATDKTIFQHMDSAAVFSDYLMKSKHMVKKLHEIQVSAKRTKGGHTAYVASIKQEKEIYDTIIKHGQDFGFIERKAQQTDLNVKGGLTFSAVSADDMRQEIARQVKELNELAQGKPIEMRPELLGVTPEDVQSFVPTNVTAVTEEPKPKPKKKRKRKKKTKTRLRK